MTIQHDVDPRGGETPATPQPSSACRFQPSDQLQRRYRAALVPLWLRSAQLDYIGAGAVVTSFRLFDRCQAGKKVPGIVRIGLLDPRSTVEIERVAKLLRRSPSELRDQTLISLIALHDARHPDLRVYLLDEPIHGRIESFDGGAFVAPYVGADRFHATVLHPAGTDAYGDIQATMESALSDDWALRLGGVDGPGRSSSDNVRSDDDLAELLADLGSRRELVELRRECVRSFERLRGDVERGLGVEVDYF